MKALTNLFSFQGEWGTTAMDADPSKRPQETDVQTIRESLASLIREFRVLIAVLLTDLAYQGDTEMRFLGIRLNYNEVLRHQIQFSAVVAYVSFVGLSTCSADRRPRWARAGRTGR